ncbi:4-(cytidine 5'-diphospho)-2-C-methyl-D-erythritol kinase [Ornithinicoccus hortensis]|uniref:4-diphosphocytidyl-2-C-methyl-D-erythritol kinase n=1 Tax=Ornithinicoccus hortensis TaxID=82346 RepID=A0A542YVJ4_9MICO|nr:4-(cytidine 5'-diphospho)-2-C-methyl-D-erythritol kinase [Ornithinicoccus hortensis]TQL52097.1 4-diphosphocytidyl-2-C-methyl-D-erythritol kinase [Ornithinicoccus hortensis]
MTLAATPTGVTARVPGKINLQLVVGPLREDGYHELATVFHAVGLYDHVIVTPSDDWSVRVGGRHADRVPQDGSNLALRAARLLAEESGGQQPVSITIDKQIPVAAGMAGGSADAAGALVACDALWGLGLSRDELAVLAARLGSDVPFLLHGGTAIGSGRGEQLAPVLARGRLHWVLWISRHGGLSTPEVYAECDRLREAAGHTPPDPEPTGELLTALRTMESTAVGAALHNDLQEAAMSLDPTLATVVQAGLDLDVEGAVVSGSGPTVAFLVGSSDAAIDLTVGLAARGPEGDIVRVDGPVPGAQVVGSFTPSAPGPTTSTSGSTDGSTS